MKIVQEKGKLKYNCYSKKQSILSNTILIILTIILGFIYFVLIDWNFLITFVLYFINWFSIAILVNYYANDFEKALLKYNKTLDFKALENVVSRCLLRNLHSETRKELILRYTVILFAYDKEKAISLFSTIDIPQNELWAFQYELKKIEYFLEEGKEDVAKQLFYELKAKPTKNKRILNVISFTEQLYFQKEENIKLVNRLIFSSKQNKFLKAASYYNLMEYYISRQNEQEARKYAEEFLKLKSKMLEYEKKANELLNENCVS